MMQGILELLFPPKCVLCRQILPKDVTDLCHQCREHGPEYEKRRMKLRCVADFTAVWYYENEVRDSLLRYKFSGKRSYAPAYGRKLAMRISRDLPGEFDCVTWVPVSARRKRSRGYDQVELLAQTVSRELGIPGERLLFKHRDNKPNSGLDSAEARRANVLGVYRAVNIDNLKNKRILLLDDILTTGATVSECARVLLSAGAKEVYCAAVAAVRIKK